MSMFLSFIILGSVSVVFPSCQITELEDIQQMLIWTEKFLETEANTDLSREMPDIKQRPSLKSDVLLSVKILTLM